MTDTDTELQHMMADKRVRRYSRSLDRALRAPGNRKEVRVKKFAKALQSADQLTELFYNIMARRGFMRGSWKRALRAMGSRLAGLTRNEPREHWIELAAQCAVQRVLQGVDEALVSECLHAGWDLLTGEKSDIVDGALAQEYQRRLKAALASPEALKRRKKPHTPPPPIVGSSAKREVSRELARDLREQSDLERIQEQKAAKSLREALQVIRPYAREVIIGRVADRMSYAELAEKNQMTADEVVDILGQARGFVRKYTNYFDDDWWWEDIPEDEEALVKTEVEEEKEEGTEEEGIEEEEEQDEPPAEGSMAFPPE
jgi:hypothetical protein